MRKFETDVQMIKYNVLKEVAALALEGTLEEEHKQIPEKIVKGLNRRIRCCVYKEKAVTEERVQLAMGGDKANLNYIEVLDVACEECPIDRFTVTEACRGCLAHRCSEACPVGAIFHVGLKAYINQQKCIECGKCKAACPYDAISDVLRPCRRACPTGAISMNEDRKASIDIEKCIQCGACVYQCPFGAIMDKSEIVDIIKELKSSEQSKRKVYAVIAPAISSQFAPADIGQVVNAIKKIGFHHVVEAALGADMVALHETKEFAEELQHKSFMTSSCCPAFVSYVKQKYPSLAANISVSVSPMIAVSRLIKKTDENAVVVFIGPCIAKKMEAKDAEVAGSTDYVMTFEELCALIDAMKIDIASCERDVLDNASFFGRIFARSGGLIEAIQHVIAQYGVETDFQPVCCDGIEECDKALKLAKVNRLDGNFIEGMACRGGCIGGPTSLNHGPKDKKAVDRYGELAIEKGIKDSLRVFDMEGIPLKRTK